MSRSIHNRNDFEISFISLNCGIEMMDKRIFNALDTVCGDPELYRLPMHVLAQDYDKEPEVFAKMKMYEARLENLRVTYITRPDTALGDVRVRGIEACTARYCYSMDDDPIFSEDASVIEDWIADVENSMDKMDDCTNLGIVFTLLTRANGGKRGFYSTYPVKPSIWPGVLIDRTIFERDTEATKLYRKIKSAEDICLGEVMLLDDVYSLVCYTAPLVSLRTDNSEVSICRDGCYDISLGTHMREYTLLCKPFRADTKEIFDRLSVIDAPNVGDDVTTEDEIRERGISGWGDSLKSFKFVQHIFESALEEHGEAWRIPALEALHTEIVKVKKDA